MKRFLTAANIVFFAVAAPCYAAVPTPESIDTLLQVTNMQAMLDSMYTNMEQTMRQVTQQMSAGQALSDEQKRVIESAPREFVEVMHQDLSWDKLKPIYVNIYRESFTQEEIDGLVAFYRSPAGDALVKKMPVVMQKSMLAMQGLLAPMIERMKAAMQDKIANAKVAQPSDTKK